MRGTQKLLEGTVTMSCPSAPTEVELSQSEVFGLRVVTASLLADSPKSRARVAGALPNFDLAMQGLAMNRGQRDAMKRLVDSLLETAEYTSRQQP